MLFFGSQASGDYIGMAIRDGVLVCVYKLGGVVHEVETSQITTTASVNASDFDRVTFHRYGTEVSKKLVTHSFLLQHTDVIDGSIISTIPPEFTKMLRSTS